MESSSYYREKINAVNKKIDELLNLQSEYVKFMAKVSSIISQVKSIQIEDVKGISGGDMNSSNSSISNARACIASAASDLSSCITECNGKMAEIKSKILKLEEDRDTYEHLLELAIEEEDRLKREEEKKKKKTNN